MKLEDFKIGEQRDWKFGVITREVYRVSENKFEIHDTSSGWMVAKVSKSTMLKLTSGEVSLLDIDFN